MIQSPSQLELANKHFLIWLLFVNWYQFKSHQNLHLQIKHHHQHNRLWLVAEKKVGKRLHPPLSWWESLTFLGNQKTPHHKIQHFLSSLFFSQQANTKTQAKETNTDQDITERKTCPENSNNKAFWQNW